MVLIERSISAFSTLFNLEDQNLCKWIDSCEDTFTTTENKSKTKALENVSVLKGWSSFTNFLCTTEIESKTKALENVSVLNSRISFSNSSLVNESAGVKSTFITPEGKYKTKALKTRLIYFSD